MKKVLIIGSNSYVGNALEKWLNRYTNKYLVDKLSVRNDKWKTKPLSHYDVIVYVAGIAHQKEKRENKHLYFSVNRDLAYEVATYAKKCRVEHFVFLSSMAVYGQVGDFNSKLKIDQNSQCSPSTYYGLSKFEAEKLIKKLESNSFKVSIVRPPMIYGPKCKGNYEKLRKITRKIFIFPMIENKRSMIHIDNMSNFLKVIIDEQANGLFLPQDEDYHCTSEIIKNVSKENKKRIYFTKIFNGIIFALGDKIPFLKKIFGDLVYSKEKSTHFQKDYLVIRNVDSIIETERLWSDE